jgi:hypothetical protein
MFSLRMGHRPGRMFFFLKGGISGHVPSNNILFKILTRRNANSNKQIFLGRQHRIFRENGLFVIGNLRHGRDSETRHAALSYERHLDGEERSRIVTADSELQRARIFRWSD